VASLLSVVTSTVVIFIWFWRDFARGDQPKR